MLSIKNLSATVDGKSILNDFSLNMNEGEIHAIMGPNGCGKSTLANVLAGKEDYEINSGKINIEDVNENLFSQELYTKNLPDPDLLIRTSGEKRISNFLLWQLAYTELVFLDVLWPDFKKKHFADALNQYSKRVRRYGSR